MSTINFPIIYIPDPEQGRPLFFGKVFVGQPDLDPEIVGNQKQLNVVQEDGTVVPVSQPLILSAGGVPVYNGSPVRLDVAGNYSIKILSKLDVQVYYVDNVFEGDPVLEADLPALVAPIITDELINDLSQAYEVTSIPTNTTIVFPVGKVITIREYAGGNNNGGQAIADVVLTSTVTPNGIDLVQFTNTPTLTMQIRITGSVNEIGATPNGADSSDIIERATELSELVSFQQGSYALNGIFLDKDFNAEGEVVLIVNGDSKTYDPTKRRVI